MLQSLTLEDDLGFLVINGENKIDVIDAHSFERRQSYTDPQFDKPRFAEVINNKAYFSVWGPYGEGGFSLVDSYVLVVDLATHSITKKISTDEGTDNLLYADGFLFASNNNFGASNHRCSDRPTLTLVDISQAYLVRRSVRLKWKVGRIVRD